MHLRAAARHLTSMILISVTTILATLATAYVALTVVAYRLQDRLLFRPSRRPIDTLQAGITNFTRVSLLTSDGSSTHAWYRPPRAGRPTVLYLHGSGGDPRRRLPRMRMMANMDWGLMFPEYRGYGGMAGRPSEAGLIEDADVAMVWLLRSTRPMDIIVYGKSLGTAVAVRLANRRAVAGVILEAGFTSVADVAAARLWFLPVRLLMRNRFDTIGHIRNINAPLLMLHGDRDTIVPIWFARRLYAHARRPKCFHAIPTGTHRSSLLDGGLPIIARFVDDVASHQVAATTGEAVPQTQSDRQQTPHTTVARPLNAEPSNSPQDPSEARQRIPPAPADRATRVPGGPMA